LTFYTKNDLIISYILKNTTMMKNMKTKGFTLIEILIVITIIGVLAALSAGALSALGGAKSRDAVRISDLNQIATMVGSLTNRFHVAPMTTNGRKYPDKCKDGGAAMLGQCFLELKMVDKQSLLELLEDPKQGANVPGSSSNIFQYYYGVDAQGNGYKICAYMEDQGAFENINAQGSTGDGKEYTGGTLNAGEGMNCIVRGEKGWSSSVESINTTTALGS